MKTVSAAEANRHFSKILREVRAGETVLVTSHGEPVATIAPANPNSEDREAARRDLLEHLRAEPTLNIPIAWSREDIYDDKF